MHQETQKRPSGADEPEVWIQSFGAKPKALLRLFCFPYAGGGPGVYRDWQASSPAWVDVAPVLMPGRERRLAERPYDQMGPLVSRLVEVLPFDKPYALFGHSLGSLVSFELVREIERRGLPGPVHLFVSACRPPHVITQKEPRHLLSDEAFTQELHRLGGTEGNVLKETELMQLLMPGLKADFALADTYCSPLGEPLGCPISAFGGESDPEVTLDYLRGWGPWSAHPLHIRRFFGDHFYLNDGSLPLRQEIFRILGESLGSLPRPRT